MRSIFKPLVITTVLATSALWAQAQTPPAAAPTQAHAMQHHARLFAKANAIELVNGAALVQLLGKLN